MSLFKCVEYIVRSARPEKFEKKGLLNDSAKRTGKQLCAAASFTIRVQAECIKQNFYVVISYPAQVFSN